MEVVIAHPFDPMNLREGGSIRYAWQLVQQLLLQGKKIHLLGVQLGKTRFEHPDVNFVPLVRGSDRWYFFHLNLMRKIPALSLPKNSIIHVMRPDFMFPFVFHKLRNPKVLTSDKPDEWMRREHPVIYRFGGRLVRDRMELHVMKNINHLITDVQSIKYYLNRYPWISKRFTIHQQGIDLDKFKPMDRAKLRKKYDISDLEKVVLFVGRIARVKNIELLLHSFSEVEKRVSNALLIIAGRGESAYVNSLRALAEELGIKKVRFLGEVHPDLVPEIYNCADVLVLTSVIEGGPYVIPEAIACGTPVVSTDVGNVRERLVNNFVGRVVKSDPASIADVISEYLLASDPMRERIRLECLKARESFSMFHFGDLLTEVYRKALQDWESRSNHAS
jgi:glycosyltransferase involved in cell wall biosynthesis